ncbi:MAG: UDP-N-acetylmuramate--L-alanine ligase [Planctomycetota bacterium]
MGHGMETPQLDCILNEAEEEFAHRRVHLIGMGGSGMRALAKMLLSRGARVSGSDAAQSGALQRLAAQGAQVCLGQRPENLPDPCDLVVHSAAIHDQNPELLAARQRGVEVLKYSQMLGRLMATRLGVAVAGTHGKSTTSGMVSYTLSAAGAEPSYIIGAVVEQLGGPCGVGNGRHFVAEACEFDRSFLNLQPYLATILNVEEDHLDCYRDLEAIIEAFRAFAGRVSPDGVLVVNGEDRNAIAAAEGASCQVETFGVGEGHTWRAENVSTDRGRASMDIVYRGQAYARIDVPLPGLHNAYNTLAAVGLLHHAGLDVGQIAAHLPRFAGTYRRMTRKGGGRGVTVLDDYAHHPTEIQATLRAIRDAYEPERLFCIFQPHQHSRTRFLLKDFARSFGLADEVLVPDIYFVRDSEREKEYICSEDLVSQIRLHGGAARYLGSAEEILACLRAQLAEGDLVVTMGAGNVWEAADELVRWLGRDR